MVRWRHRKPFAALEAPTKMETGAMFGTGTAERDSIAPDNDNVSAAMISDAVARWVKQRTATKAFRDHSLPVSRSFDSNKQREGNERRTTAAAARQ